jgi:hypothetical protein
VIAVWSPLVTSPLVRVFVTVVGLAMALAGFLYPVVMYLKRASAVAPASVRFVSFSSLG